MAYQASLSQPERLDILGPEGAVTRGAEQEWYPDRWQRLAGCGPTSASVIFAYVSRTHPELSPLCPEDVTGREAFTALMGRVWEYVTPVFHGLNKPELMVEGMAAYARSVGVELSPALFPVPAARTKRLPYEQAAAFVTASLERDCPVAFLNLHNGLEKRLDWWHWVTIVALDGDNVSILDSGEELEINLRLWYETSKKRAAWWPPWGWTDAEVDRAVGAGPQYSGLCPHGRGQGSGPPGGLAGAGKDLFPGGRSGGLPRRHSGDTAVSPQDPPLVFQVGPAGDPHRPAGSGHVAFLDVQRAAVRAARCHFSGKVLLFFRGFAII